MWSQINRVIALIIGSLVCASCDDGYLRGTVQQSPDGKTYLHVVTGNNCEQVKVDGKIWSPSIGKAGVIEPGRHLIDCNGEIEFDIPKGVIFKFDYWGP